MKIVRKESFDSVLTYWKNKEKTNKKQSKESNSMIKSKDYSNAKCNDVKPKPLSQFKNKSDRRAEMRERCTAQGKATKKNCKVPHTKKLVCHESRRKKS